MKKKMLINILTLIVIVLVFIFGQRYLKHTDMSMLNSYTNTGYGFSLQYPKTALMLTSFSSFHLLSPKWIADPMAGNAGSPLVSIVMTGIENTPYYPRYFGAELRIGVSKDEKDVKNCLVSSYNSLPPTTQVINGVTFRIFPIQDAAMMQYIQGLSYRVVHNGVCFVMEQLKVGSNYRDEYASGDIAQSVLDAYYTGMDTIVQTFTFLK